MATYKPGRLKRVLSAITGNQWQFAAITSSYTMSDDEITSIVIHRGTDGRNTGHHPTTCEVGMTGRKDNFGTGDQMRVVMRASPAQSLAEYLGGGITGPDIATRFKGRRGTAELEDTGKSFHTTIAGSSYLTQMNYSPASFTPGAKQNLGSLLLDMTKANEPVRGVEFGTLLGEVNMVHFAAGEATLYKDGIGPFAEDIGVMMQERRDGSTLAVGIPARISWASNRISSQLPLMRAQAIAPGRYAQHNEQPAIRVEYKVFNESGGVATRVAEVANPSGELRETQQVDWTRWQATALGGQLSGEAYARVMSSSARLYTMPSVTIDMLMLLRNPGEYSRRIARQILLLEVGEPIFLAGDWPATLRGVHFADGITETIGPDEWTFELSLVPHAVATGESSPPVPARAWGSAVHQWNEETREWNQA